MCLHWPAPQELPYSRKVLPGARCVEGGMTRKIILTKVARDGVSVRELHSPRAILHVLPRWPKEGVGNAKNQQYGRII